MHPLDSAAQAARSRLEHVSKRGQELADSIAAWRGVDPVGFTVAIAEDRLSWEARWQVSDPPVRQWALILGDAVHHLRAMLDNLVHHIAEQEGATARQLSTVQFPIAVEPANWSDQKGRIAMLPERVRAAIESVQPFQRPEAESSSDSLAILGRLSNADKHRMILVGLIQPNNFEHSVSVSFEDGAPSDAGPPRTEVFVDVIDGAPAMRHDTSPDRIAEVKLHLRGDVQVVVVDQAGNQWGMTSGLAAIATYVPKVLDIVLAAWAEDRARA